MVKTAQVIAVIPARAHSTRFPFKIIAPILGKPMVQYVWESAKMAKTLDDVWIATDHEEIFNCVKSFGGNVVMTPSDLPSGSDRVARVSRDMTANIIVNLQGDEPLLKSEYIDRLVESLKQHPEAQITTLALKRTDLSDLNNPNCVKVVCDDFGRALYFSRQPLSSSENGEFLKHVGIYAYRRESLFEFCRLSPSSLERSEKLEQLRALQNGMKIQVCLIEQDSIAVDVPEDIKKVEDYLKKNILSHGKIELKEDS